MRGSAVLVITRLRMYARLVCCSVTCSLIVSVSLRSREYFLDGDRLFTRFVKWRLCSVTVLCVTVSFEFARHLPMSKRRPDHFLTTVALILFLLRTTIASQALCTSSALSVQLVTLFFCRPFFQILYAFCATPAPKAVAAESPNIGN